jgi:hypothetical protein
MPRNRVRSSRFVGAVTSNSEDSAVPRDVVHGTSSIYAWGAVKRWLRLVLRLGDPCRIAVQRGLLNRCRSAASVMNEDTQLHQGFDLDTGAASANVELKKVNVAGPSAREIELQIRTGADIPRNGISFIRNNRSKPLELRPTRSSYLRQLAHRNRSSRYVETAL